MTLKLRKPRMTTKRKTRTTMRMRMRMKMKMLMRLSQERYPKQLCRRMIPMRSPLKHPLARKPKRPKPQKRKKVAFRKYELAGFLPTLPRNSSYTFPIYPKVSVLQHVQSIS